MFEQLYSRITWRHIYFTLLVILTTCFWYSIPSSLFDNPTCTVLYDNKNGLLSASIADDGQYRFPVSDSIPYKLNRCIITFEDKYFYDHPGVNPAAILRALKQNVKERKIVSGASTITMQVIRLSRRNPNRTLVEKIKEIVMSLRLEISYSKEEILRLYVSNAPFGGNVVGVDAAAWRYYGRSVDKLSWAEAAALAVLPNAPSMIFPGRNKKAFLAKRDRLLGLLHKNNEIDSLTYLLSLQEPLPEEPQKLPQSTPHLLTRSIKDGFKGKQVKTTINPFYQNLTNEIIDRHRKTLEANSIHNAAVLVVEVETGNVLAYIGNTLPDGLEHDNYVDCIQAPRSTGSILKPFLYASMLNEGLILPNTLVPDIPTQIGDYTPKNFNPRYDGAVPASRALARSLNVPAVRMLHSYGIEKFHDNLKKIGLTTINRPASNYGLSLILGGAEATLWDLAGVYSSLARSLNHFKNYQSRYSKSDYHPPRYLLDSNTKDISLTDYSLLNASSIYITFEAMKEVARPDELAGWKYFSSTRSIAWKTGTSFGHRDAWAIGLNPNFVVAVWVGNATGEGRPDLTGVSVAAPILFEVFGILPECSWFNRPVDDMAYIPVCRQSGYRATEICSSIDTIWVPIKGLETAPCPYHKIIHLDRDGRYRVTDKCEKVSLMKHEPWFILPPAIEWFYKSSNPDYRSLPPFKPGCSSDANIKSMAIIYPRIYNSRISIPKNIDGTLSETVFEIAHRRSDATIYWHLDDQYIGLSTTFHKMALQPSAGKHTLTLVDDTGEMLVTNFEILGN